jgi:hypothetical protein
VADAGGDRRGNGAADAVAFRAGIRPHEPGIAASELVGMEELPE